jgi:hypothetical protein
MSDQSEQQSPFKSRRFILSVVVVGVIALCAVIVLVSNLFDTGKDDPAPVASATSTATAAPVDDDPSACGLEGYETESTLTDAPASTWALVGTVAAPSDPEGAGPGDKTSQGLPSCYAHTAEGALYAATNFIAVGTDANLRSNLAPLVAPGEGRKAAEAEQGESNANSSSFRAQVTGFKVDGYDGNTATVDLALNYNDGQLVSLPVQLQWAEGDWKVVLTSEGDMPLAPAPLQSLGGYTPWAGA